MSPEVRSKREAVSKVMGKVTDKLHPPPLRTAITSIRLTPDELANLKEGALRAGLSLMDYLLALHDGYQKARKG